MITDYVNSNAIFYQYTAESFAALDTSLEANTTSKAFIADVTESSSAARPSGGNHYTAIGWLNGGHTYGYQLVFTFDGKIYKRIRNNSSSWGAWISVTLT